MAQLTYRALIEPIPFRFSIANAHDQEASTTCHHCQALSPDRSKIEQEKSKRVPGGFIKTTYDRIDHYPDFPKLKESGRTCALCKLIRKGIRSAWAARPMEEIGVGPLTDKNSYDLLTSRWDGKLRIYNARFDTTIADVTFGSMIWHLSINLSPLDEIAGHGYIGSQISFKVFDQQDLESQSLANRRRLPSVDALSTANITMLNHWITECKGSHQKCQAESSTWLPSRLLDVGSWDYLPRLIETSSGEVKGRYAALSHMWGDTTYRLPLRTLKSNYEDMKAGISMSTLPKNFVQAIIVCRRLRIQYVWIDSLCIIQDSYDDWRHEAALMHLVYRFAEVTIVATSALSTHDGFLDRNLTQLPAVKVEYSPASSPDNVTTMILQYDEAEGGFGQINGSTWNTRGWTMQERSLSTRSVHFCKNKIFYECRQGAKSEENEPIPHYHPEFYLWPRHEDWMKGQNTPEKLAALKERFYEQWKTMLHHYTLRNLTNGSDKLPAILSTAEQMKSNLDDDYIAWAGMWLGNLESELLWKVDDGPSFKSNEWRAPTWSWASINGKITYNSYVDDRANWKEEDRGSLTTASIQVKHPQALQVQPEMARLEIKGFLQPLSFIEEVDPDERWLYYTRIKLPYDLHILASLETETQSVDTSPFASRQQRESAIENGEVVKFAEGRLDMDNKDSLVTSTRKLFYLHINYIRTPTGLILESTERGFERVGVASIFAEDDRYLICPGRFKQEIAVTEVSIV